MTGSFRSPPVSRNAHTLEGLASMNSSVNPRVSDPGLQRAWRSAPARVVFLMMTLYAFLVSIGMLGKAFKLVGSGFVDNLIYDASNPLIGLFVGILATSIVQSSSTTTSLVVAMVGSGTMPVETAIPVVMGANIGTTVTNYLVSLGHVSHGGEFNRALSASNIHDFFNFLAVLVLFPLQLATNFLGISCGFLASLFQKIGGETFTSPLQIIVSPAVEATVRLLSDRPWLLMVVAIGVMFGSLRYLVVILKGLVLRRIESLFDRTIFRNAGRAMLFGVMITVLVQSSSITTALAVPLAGTGILTLRQIFPYALGANVGTTITAILAAFAVGEISALTVAFAHLVFNVTGILVVWPIPSIRQIPITLAEKMAQASSKNRLVPLVYVISMFYVIPFLMIMILK